VEDPRRATCNLLKGVAHTSETFGAQSVSLYNNLRADKRPVGAVTLTGRDYSAKLAPDPALIDALRNKHGSELEDWWRSKFGYGFDQLTQSGARYLERSGDADTITKRMAEARQEKSP